MRFGMVGSRFLIFLLLVSLVPVSPTRAEDLSAPDEYISGASSEPNNVLGEASKAVIGRVFGVKGEGGNIDYHVVEFSKVSPVNSAVRSALIPGWGQSFNRQKVKAWVHFLTFSASTIGALNLRSKYKDTFDDYEAKGVKDDALYDDYEDQRMQASLLGGAAILIWLLSIRDAYKNAYNPLYTRNIHFDVAHNSEETEIRVSKKF